MTNAIEQTKREMYEAWRSINNFAKMNCHVSIVKLLKDFNEPLEEHLAELHKACAGHEALHQTARQRFEDIQALDRKCAELQSELARVTTERDSYRNRLQAIDHASQPKCMHSFLARRDAKLVCTFCGAEK